jgi:Fur family ferric uptake transcriptional regulator
MKMNFNFKITDLARARAVIRNRRGLKISRKRAAVIEHFFTAGRHSTAEELYRSLRHRQPGTSFSTVYRALKLLVDCGLATGRRFKDGITRFEPVRIGRHHDHLICLGCGRIIEFKSEPLETLQRAIARKHAFDAVDHRLELYGYCRACRRKIRHG